MSLDQISALKTEQERVVAIYEVFDENNRLNHSQAAQVEFYTTMHYIQQYLSPGSKVLDIGPGAGEYSLALAQSGYEVTAVELSPANIKAFEQKITPQLPVTLIQGTALDLSQFIDEQFDLVLLMGPLYHLENEEDRLKAISEAKRVVKKDGVIFFAFISNDMVILTEFSRRPDFFSDHTYYHATFKVKDFPFVFSTVDQVRQLLGKADIITLHEIASDGVSELMENNINALSEEEYRQYLRYHLYCCEKPEMLGRSNHLLWIGKK